MHYLDRVKRLWYLSPMRAAKVQASLHIRAVSPEPSLLAHTSSESRGTFRQKARSLAPLNGWAWAVKICHDGMLEDTNSLDRAHLMALCPFQQIVFQLDQGGSVVSALCSDASFRLGKNLISCRTLKSVVLTSSLLRCVVSGRRYRFVFSIIQPAFI